MGVHVLAVEAPEPLKFRVRLARLISGGIDLLEGALMSEPAIPAKHPRTAHLMPYWWNNSFLGILRAFVLRFKFFDQDSNCDADGMFWGGHWALPRMDGFTWVFTGKRDKLGREIRVKDPHPNRPIHERSTAEMRTLRRGRYARGTYQESWRHAYWISKRGGVMCLEAKGSPGFEDPANWEKFWALLVANCPRAVVYVMTLQDIRGWYARMKAAHTRFQTALLPRRAQPTGADWTRTQMVVDAFWGKFVGPVPPRPVVTSVAQQVIAVARGEIGYHEGRSGGHWNNDEKYASMVPGLAWANFQPWCDTFVAACFKMAGALELLAGGPTASTDLSMANWKKAGRWSEYPAIGAQVLFGSNGNPDHTGIVASYGPTTITTIEGNTNTSGSREGDGVYLKTHRRADPRVLGYGYPKYPEGIVSADPAWKGRK